jgi:hypothetical protein
VSLAGRPLSITINGVPVSGVTTAVLHTTSSSSSISPDDHNVFTMNPCEVTFEGECDPALIEEIFITRRQRWEAARRNAARMLRELRRDS